jgi:hypothetical protein
MPTVPATPARVIDVAQLAPMRYPEAEAALALELDRIHRLQADDPLEGLEQILTLMQGLNMELLKAYAPVLVEDARRQSDAFMQGGSMKSERLMNNRALNGYLRLQEGVAKLAAAQVKVRDEKEQRHAYRAND